MFEYKPFSKHLFKTVDEIKFHLNCNAVLSWKRIKYQKIKSNYADIIVMDQSVFYKMFRVHFYKKMFFFSSTNMKSSRIGIHFHFIFIYLTEMELNLHDMNWLYDAKFPKKKLIRRWNLIYNILIKLCFNMRLRHSFWVILCAL